jgi:hypothetical protein
MTAVLVLRPVRGNSDDQLFEVVGLNGASLGKARKSKVELVKGTVVPAAPGWRVAYYPRPGEGEFEFWFEPIVAWRVDGSSVFPLTNKVAMLDENYVIVAPDGHTTAPGIGSWDSLDEAAAALQVDRRKAPADTGSAIP